MFVFRFYFVGWKYGLTCSSAFESIGCLCGVGAWLDRRSLVLCAILCGLGRGGEELVLYYIFGLWLVFKELVYAYVFFYKDISCVCCCFFALVRLLFVCVGALFMNVLGLFWVCASFCLNLVFYLERVE